MKLVKTGLGSERGRELPTVRVVAVETAVGSAEQLDGETAVETGQYSLGTLPEGI